MGSDPTTIREALAPYLSKLGLPDMEAMVTLRDQWEEVAGPPWDEWAEPVTLEGEVLVVRALSGTVVRPLRYASGDLVRRCDEQLGQGVITSVRVLPPR